jgi:hypothetical protein
MLEQLLLGVIPIVKELPICIKEAEGKEEEHLEEEHLEEDN